MSDGYLGAFFRRLAVRGSGRGLPHDSEDDTPEASAVLVAYAHACYFGVAFITAPAPSSAQYTLVPSTATPCGWLCPEAIVTGAPPVMAPFGIRRRHAAAR
jgi:hypothetical protein